MKKYPPKSRDEVFYPCMDITGETKKVRIKAIFPEYVFLYTDMNMKEVYQMIRDVVLEVSLRAYADRIINVDKHNRRAFLEFEINGSRAHARRA